MSNIVYFITDDSCEPLDPGALSVTSMHRSLYLERYGNLDYAFESREEAHEFLMDVE